VRVALPVSIERMGGPMLELPFLLEHDAWCSCGNVEVDRPILGHDPTVLHVQALDRHPMIVGDPRQQRAAHREARLLDGAARHPRLAAGRR